MPVTFVLYIYGSISDLIRQLLELFQHPEPKYKPFTRSSPECKDGARSASNTLKCTRGHSAQVRDEHQDVDLKNIILIDEIYEKPL